MNPGGFIGLGGLESELLQDGYDEHEKPERAEDDQPHEESSDAREPGVPIVLGLPPAKGLESGVSLSPLPFPAIVSVHGHLLCFTFHSAHEHPR